MRLLKEGPVHRNSNATIQHLIRSIDMGPSDMVRTPRKPDPSGCARNLCELARAAFLSSQDSGVVAAGRRRVCHSVAFLTATRGDSRHARSAQMVADRAGLSTNRRMVSIRALSPLTFATPSKRLSYVPAARHRIVLS